MYIYPRRILTFLLVLSGFVSRSQIVVPRAPSNIVVQDSKLYITSNFKIPVFADTAAANTALAHDSIGVIFQRRSTGVVYVRDTNSAGSHRWTALASGGSSGVWGSITGTLTDQTDLNTALLGKQNVLTTGTNLQYFRGDLTLATFPTAVSSFTNDAAYIATVVDSNSITGMGVTGSALHLVADQTSPGNYKHYGTNSSGVKGWYADSIAAGSGGTVTSITANAPLTGGTITTVGSIGIDTGAGKIATQTMLALKLKISDTSAMLTPYLRKADTTAMLSPYARKNTKLDSIRRPAGTDSIYGYIGATRVFQYMDSSGGGGGGSDSAVLAGSGLSKSVVSTAITLRADTSLLATKTYVRGFTDTLYIGHTGTSTIWGGYPSTGFDSLYLKSFDPTQFSTTSDSMIHLIAGATTASNGLTKVSNDIELGGYLTKVDTIFETGTNAIKIIDSGSATGLQIVGRGTGAGLSVTNTASSGYSITGQNTFGNGINGISTSGFAFNGSSTSGTGGYFISGSGVGVQGTSTTSLAGFFVINPATTNSIDPVLKLQRQSTGTPANGIGGSIQFYTATSTSTLLSNELVSKWTDVTNATRTSQFDIKGLNSASTETYANFQTGGIVRVNNLADTLATKAYARSVGGGGGGSSSGIGVDTVQAYTSGTTLTQSASTNYIQLNPASVQSTLTITTLASGGTWHTSNDLYIVAGGTVTSGTVITTLTITAGSGLTIVDDIPPTTISTGHSLHYHKVGTLLYRIKD